LNVVGGQLVGASDVNVGGGLYDVEFVDGKCLDLFNGCDSAADFTFNNGTDALLASQALLNEVLLDGSSGLFDAIPSLTMGCDDPSVCSLLTPFAVDAVAVQLGCAQNGADPGIIDVATLCGSFGVGTSTEGPPSFAFVRWTPTSARAQLIESIDFEDLNLGSIQGQGGWSSGGGPGDIVVVGDVVSPLDQSTRAIRLTGVPVSNNIFKTLGETFSEGYVSIRYDYLGTTLIPGDNAVAFMLFADRFFRVPLGLYPQNGGLGPSPNALLGDPLTGQSAFTGLLDFPPGTFSFPVNKWLRFESLFDLNDAGRLLKAELFDISSGIPVLISSRDIEAEQDLFFISATPNAPVLQELTALFLGSSGIENGTQVYLDNIHIVPEPSSALLLVSAAAALAFTILLKRRTPLLVPLSPKRPAGLLSRV
jgi:hypothetical protein